MGYLCVLIEIDMSIDISSSPQGEEDHKQAKHYPYTNELIHSSSPYLLQHAHNPVNWYPWGEKALKKAAKENKLLIISVGYSACHWCHVMERQSYSDTSVADYMNTHFVSVKVDREERPDIDQIYMNACQLINGNGGWPLNAFALPDGKPFFAVTYLPQDRWLELLRQLVKLNTEEPNKVREQAEKLTQGIQGDPLVRQPVDTAKEELQAIYNNLFSNVQTSVDLVNGGFGSAPKFPMPNAWEMLLQIYYLNGNRKALDAVNLTLHKMASGGIYDQLGGGFARYSVDQRWHIPHFEKMLYDNAQLISLYAKAYKITHDELYREVIKQTLSFIQREMTSSEGGFYSSINADSEGKEGKFYVWSKKEVDILLNEKDAAIINSYYGITNRGNWEEDNNILYNSGHDADVARQFHLKEKELHAVLNQAKSILFRERRKRIPPSLDDKILVSWNALMIIAYLDAYHAWGNQDYLESALKCAGFIKSQMVQKDGSILRNYLEGKSDITGMLDDYAFFSSACIALYQSTFDIQWLTLAKELIGYTLNHFYDPKSGMFYYTSDKSSSLIARNQEMEDNVMPSSNSVMANDLYELGIYFDVESYKNLSKTMLNGVLKAIPASPVYFSNWAQLLGKISYPVREIAIVGKKAKQTNDELRRHYLPDALFMGGEEENLPLLKNKITGEQTTIYVCDNNICKQPVTDVKIALEQMKR